MFSSVQFSCSVVSDSLRPHESQHARPPCPSPSPRVHSDSRPSSPWCHPAVSSSVVPFSSYPQSLPASESFPMSQLFAWGGQSTGASALASFLPKKSQGWSPSEWTVGSHQKNISHIQGQRRGTNKTAGGAKLCLESNPIPTRDTWRAQTKPCVHQGTPQKLSQTCLWVSECLLQRHGSAVDCHRGRGSGCSRPKYGISPLGGGCH